MMQVQRSFCLIRFLFLLVVGLPAFPLPAVLGGVTVPEDNFEPNDSMLFPTVLNSAPNVFLSGLTIHFDGPASDDDWFRFRPQQSGKLNFQALFFHAAGDLDIALFDAGSNVIAQHNPQTTTNRLSCRWSRKRTIS
jgi:hypothetical protein